MMKKIYNFIKIDIETNRVIEEDYFLYDGEISECKGESRTTTTIQSSGDPESQRRLAGVAERQVALSEEQMDIAKRLYQPYEEDIIAANRQIIPFNTQLIKEQLTSETKLTPLRTQALSEGLKAAIADLHRSEPAKAAFMKEALEGINIGERVGKAGADVSSSFKTARESLLREGGRLGLSTERLAPALSKIKSDEALASALAKTSARTTGKAEQFARLSAAAGQPLGVATLGATKQILGEQQLGGFQLQDPTNKALRSLEGASASYARSGSFAPKTVTETVSRSGGGGFGSIVGGIVGGLAGSFAGGAGAQLGARLGAKLPS